MKFIAVLFTGVIVIFSSTTPVAAITPENKRAIDLMAPIYYGGDVCEPGSGSSSNTDVSGIAENEEAAFFYFVNKGFSNEQAAGVVGNFVIESGINPEREQVGGGPGRGIAQWEAGGRWDNLLDWASSNNSDPLALQTQLDFVWYELESDSTWGLEELQETSTIEEATKIFMEKFERPRDQSQTALDKRVRPAERIFDTYSGENPTNYSSAENCRSTSGGEGDVVQIAQQELASNISESDNSHGKYIEGVSNASLSQEWCGYFVSWVLKKAGHPFTEGVDGYVQPAVQGILEYARDNGKFYEPGEQNPEPGDLAIYKNGVSPWRSHVNIVISYDESSNTYESIGGNEGDAVKKSENSMNSPSLTGFMRVD